MAKHTPGPRTRIKRQGGERAAAEDAVAGVAGVLSVTNQIKVQGGA